MKYTVYFEIYGKKLKVSIDANSPEDAKYKIMGKIKFHKIEVPDEGLNQLKEMLGIW
jgi:hypothetical protein